MTKLDEIHIMRKKELRKYFRNLDNADEIVAILFRNRKWVLRILENVRMADMFKLLINQKERANGDTND